MKITNVRTILVDGHRMNWVIVKIETDAGIHGIGDATAERREQAVVATIEAVRHNLIGKDPFKVEHLVRTINREAYSRTGVVNRSSLSGIEAALLDIKGKALGVPVYELLGGKQRDRIPCYANNWAPYQATGGATTIEAALEDVLKMGFRAAKWDPFFLASMYMHIADRRKAVDEIRRARDAGGGDVELLIEGHARFDVPTAVILGHAMAEYDPLFFEEPIPPDNLDALVEVKQRIPVPVAGGERYFERHRFMEVMDRRALDWLQPDVCHVGGLSEVKAIAALAESRFLPVSPHNPMGPVGNAMTMHLAAAIPNFVYLETMMVDVPWRGEVINEDVRMENGEVIISDAPGLGIELSEEAAAAHPFKVRHAGHYGKRDAWPEGTRPWFRHSA